VKMAGRLARLEIRHTPLQRAYQIIIYDAATGAPLPGHEPRPDAPGHIWIPANDAPPDPYGNGEREADGGDGW